MAPRSCQTPRACNEPPPPREFLAPEDSPSTPAMGSYRLLQRLGGDHVTSIYRGFDTSLNRPVAIRILNPEAAGHKELAGRFQAEAAAAAGVGHPNVVAIHFVGDEAGCPYYVMHFVEGESLASRLSRQECLAPPVAMEIARQCLAGLAAAHQRGIVHGGLHPGKILLEEPSSRAMLVDLGRLRQTAHDTRTSLAAVLHMPPELARGEPPDARSDLYAMGVVLYRMLAGRSPFEAQSPADVLYQITHGTPLALEEAAPNLPAEIRSIVPARRRSPSTPQKTLQCHFRVSSSRVASTTDKCLQSVHPGRNNEPVLELTWLEGSGIGCGNEDPHHRHRRGRTRRNDRRRSAAGQRGGTPDWRSPLSVARAALLRRAGHRRGESR